MTVCVFLYALSGVLLIAAGVGLLFGLRLSHAPRSGQ